jgi:CRISPR-associated protein Csx17
MVMERLLFLVDQFVGPLADRKTGKRWRYVGLKGGIEAGMLRLGESPFDSEAARALLDSVVGALDRIDRNRPFRAQGIAWEALPLDWLPTVIGGEGPTTEMRLALALVSSFPSDRPFALYRFGVVPRGRHFAHPPQNPKQWVWRSGLSLSGVLSEVVYRRTLDWERVQESSGPARLGLPANVDDVDSWLSGCVDEVLTTRWVSRFALFDWRAIPHSLKSLVLSGTTVGAIDGALCLFGLFQPLLDLRAVSPLNERALDLLPRESRARTPAAARRLLGLLRAGDVTAAVRFAATRYSVAGTALVRTEVPWGFRDIERLTASLLFSMSDRDRYILATRWLRPRRNQGETAYDA